MIQIKNLYKSYQDKIVLNNISLDIPKGKIFAILGPNGAGKTTMVRILSTVLSSDSGNLRVGNFDIEKDAENIRKIISVSGQYTSLDEQLTGRENLMLFSRLVGLRKKDLESIIPDQMKKFGLFDDADKLVSMYSGGMKRRLDLAIALIRQPQILFLDEPTTGLDPRSRADLWQAINELRNQEVTVILTTQYLEEADQLADEVVLIDHGVVKAHGSPSKLKSQYGQLSCAVQPLQIKKLQSIESMLQPFGATSIDKPNATVVVKLVHGMESIAGIVRQLDNAEIEIADINIQQPSLDDVFHALTDQNQHENTIEDTNYG